jgi:hypothetical protein
MKILCLHGMGTNSEVSFDVSFSPRLSELNFPQVDLRLWMVVFKFRRLT